MTNYVLPTYERPMNSDQCIDVPDIPSFLRVKTKDTRMVMEIVDKVANGEIKFPDGALVETVCIDSVSVLWSVQQEVVSKSAEKRAERYGKNKDEATLTQLDWVLAKHPLYCSVKEFNSTLRISKSNTSSRNIFGEHGSVL